MNVKKSWFPGAFTRMWRNYSFALHWEKRRRRIISSRERERELLSIIYDVKLITNHMLNHGMLKNAQSVAKRFRLNANPSASRVHGDSNALQRPLVDFCWFNRDGDFVPSSGHADVLARDSVDLLMVSLQYFSDLDSAITNNAKLCIRFPLLFLFCMRRRSCFCWYLTRTLSFIFCNLIVEEDALCC